MAGLGSLQALDQKKQRRGLKPEGSRPATQGGANTRAVKGMPWDADGDDPRTSTHGTCMIVSSGFFPKMSIIPSGN